MSAESLRNEKSVRDQQQRGDLSLTIVQKIRKQLFRHTEYLFYILSAAGTAGFFFLCLKTGDGFRWISMGNTSDWGLTDFSRHLYYAADLTKTYEFGHLACFPPLVYVFFHLLYKINPTPLENYDWLSFKESPYLVTVYVMLLVLITLLFFLFIQKIVRKKTGECVLLCALLLCSLPFFMGTIERGNPVFPTLVMILAGLYLKDSPSAAKRECALLFLAAAANFKLYPAILVLLYLKEKRWKEALRFCLYGIALFFVPFIWVGGLPGMKLYFSNLTEVSSLFVMEYSSFMHITFAILWAFHAGIETAALIGRIVGHICFVILILLTFRTRVKWKELLYLSLIMSYYLPGNYRYTVIFMTIPLLFAMRVNAEVTDRKDQKPVMRMIYMALFGLLLTIPSWLYPKRPEIMMAVSAMMIFALSGVEDLVQGKRRRSHL